MTPEIEASSAPLSTPRLRRKAPISETLQESTAVQRLVEYFVIVSSKPRWKPRKDASSANPKESPEIVETNSKKTSKVPLSEVVEEETIVESRQESPDVSVNDNTDIDDQPIATEGNIHIPQHAEEEFTFQPVITARYPQKDYDDNPLNPMILQFCYPASDVIVPATEYELPKVHHFVLTTGRGRKVYGTCLTVMEEYVYTEARDSRNLRSVTTESVAEGVELSMSQERKSTLYIPKVLCLLSTWPYLTAFREYLSQLYRLASTTNVMTAPLERYICNICKEIPAPPPGAYEVQMEILSSKIRIWAPPCRLPIAYVALPYNILFECLDLDNILLLWSNMIMERKILLLSSQYSILTICSEILTSLLFPFQWSHLYVPLLPRMLCPMLDAPVPYLCGIVRENWLHAQQFLAPDCIVVDLDRNRVKLGPMVPQLPPPPAKKWNKLETSLVDTVGHVYWKVRGAENIYRTMIQKKSSKRTIMKLRQSHCESLSWKEKLAGQDHAFNLAYTPDSPNLAAEGASSDEQSQWDIVQEAFLRFFVALLKDYRKDLTLPPTSGKGLSSKVPIKPSFDRIAFVARACVESVPFLTELCMTQQFDDFITRRMYSPGEPDLQFFDQSIDAKLNRSKLKLKKVETPLLHSAKVHKDLKKLEGLPPNEQGLQDSHCDGVSKPYAYKNLPESLDESLFSEPRPIPKMIAAEFDRQAILVSKLRASMIEEDDEDEADELLEFYGGDYDPSPEVGFFTTFLFVYCSLVGLEWQKFARKREGLSNLNSPFGNLRYEGDTRDGVEAGEMETVLPVEVQLCRRDVNCISRDLSFGVCEACPENGVFVMSSALSFLGKGAEDAFHSLFEKPFEHVPEQQSRLAQNQHEDSGSVQGDKISAEEFEEARQVASAQLDLAFETLSTLRLRGLSADSDAYLSLMEACGRCGDTKRALKLIELMKKDGFVADREVLSCFIAAFSQDSMNGSKMSRRASLNALGEFSGEAQPDAYSEYLFKRFEASQDDKSDALYSHLMSSPFSSVVNDNESRCSVDLHSDEASACSTAYSEKSSASTLMLQNWFSQQSPNTRSKKKRRRRRRKAKFVKLGMPVSPMLSRQLDLGENLLDFVYRDLTIDTNSDSCPHCSQPLSESDIVAGWVPCAFQDYTTQCPTCSHRFVPRFVVTSSSLDFQGSQGYRTPLYCEFLSPWVLRKEFQHVIKSSVGVEGMLDPKWRSGTDIQATLFWNLMVLCRRYKLPFSFLLQGSFQNRLILPRKPDEV